MKHIVVIGQSPAAYAFVKDALERDPEAQVTLISCDGALPYDHARLPGLIDRSVKESDIFCAPQDFYAQDRIKVILDKEISRVNADRHRVFLAEKVQVAFDEITIIDAPQVKLPPLKGIRRKGVFHLVRLAAVKDLIKYLTFTETALVEPLGFAGIRAVLALKAAGKDVIALVRQEALLPGILSPERSQMLVRALEGRGVRVIFSGGGVEDVIGEVEVKAVRLKSGKVVACEMFVTEDVTFDMSFLTDGAPEAVMGAAGPQPHDMLDEILDPAELVLETPEAAT